MEEIINNKIADTFCKLRGHRFRDVPYGGGFYGYKCRCICGKEWRGFVGYEEVGIVIHNTHTTTNIQI